MILLVDDDAAFLRTAQRVLAQDANILFASNGADALGLLKAIHFSVALVDLDLPDCSGFELIEKIHTASPELPIIAISGVCSQAALESAREFGAAETLRKPATREWAAAVNRLRDGDAANSISR